MFDHSSINSIIPEAFITEPVTKSWRYKTNPRWLMIRLFVMTVPLKTEKLIGFGVNRAGPKSYYVVEGIVLPFTFLFA